MVLCRGAVPFCLPEKVLDRCQYSRQKHLSHISEKERRCHLLKPLVSQMWRQGCHLRICFHRQRYGFIWERARKNNEIFVKSSEGQFKMADAEGYDRAYGVRGGH